MSPAANKKALSLIFVIVVLDLMGAGILIPVIPYIVREYRTDAATVGWLSTSFSIAQFLASPILGVLSDRYGRRPVLLFSILGTAFGYFLFGVAGSLTVLFIARIIDGATGGNISTAQSYIADITPPEDRAKSFGLIGAAFGLGFIAGPALGGILSHISLQAPAYAAGILALVTCIAGYFVLPESLPAEQRRTNPFTAGDINPFQLVSTGLRRHGLRALMAAIFFINLAFSGLQSNFAVFTMVRFNLGPSDNAILFAFLGVLAAFFQGYLIRRMIPRFGENRLATWGLAISSLGFFLVSGSTLVWMLYAAIAVIALGNSFAVPSLTGLVSKQVSAREQGFFLGVTQSVAAFTRVIGPLWAGFSFDWWGPPSPYWTGALFILAGVAAVVLARPRDSIA
ncbi:MAG: MFS transporter [Solirubrobacterales bacterium]|nr:MFS transporter [Solirubrobacterales bacterium]